MKKIYFMLAFFATVFIQSSFAQDSINIQSKALLTSYYSLKDALVSSNATTSALSASEFIAALNAFNKDVITEQSRTALVSDASAISHTNDLKVQREKFATLSTNMFELAKTVKLSSEPVYQQYCSMKKASWLSNAKAIKNPYYGNAMLTCGSVKETL